MPASKKTNSISEELQEIIGLAKENDLAEIEWQEGDKRIKICRREAQPQIFSEISPPLIHTPNNITPSSNQAVASTSDLEQKDLKKILSPMVGTFYSRPKPEANTFVKLGDKVKKGQILCIVEAMKLFNEIEAEYDCIIEEIVAKNGCAIEYNQPLFLVKPL